MSSAYLKSKLQSISLTDLEQFVASVWEHYGYQTEVTRGREDRAADVSATRELPYPLVEALRVEQREGAGRVTAAEIQEYSALREREAADVVVVVTSGLFTDQAVDIAAEVGVQLVDADQLTSMIIDDSLHPLLAEYATVTDTISHRITLEAMTDAIVEGTKLDDPETIRDSLRGFFESHPSNPSIGNQRTLNAYSNEDGWKQSTILRWGTKPDLDAEEIVDALLNEARRPNQREPTPQKTAAHAIISSYLETNLRDSPDDMSVTELADWFVDDLDRDLVPIVDENPTEARDVAEEWIDPTASVAVNRLRVGEKLERAYEQGRF